MKAKELLDIVEAKIPDYKKFLLTDIPLVGSAIEKAAQEAQALIDKAEQKSMSGVTLDQLKQELDVRSKKLEEQLSFIAKFKKMLIEKYKNNAEKIDASTPSYSKSSFEEVLSAYASYVKIYLSTKGLIDIIKAAMKKAV